MDISQPRDPLGCPESALPVMIDNTGIAAVLLSLCRICSIRKKKSDPVIE
jgi:hypothetical protein